MTSRTWNRIAAAVVGVALALGAAPATSLFATSASASSSPSISRFDYKLIVEINKARMAHGLRPLTIAPGTADVAHSWSCHMANVRVLSHNGSLANQLESHGSRLWTSYDENVGYVARSEGATRLFRAYMASPEHRANILDPAARFIGSWTKIGGHKRYNTIDFVGSRTTSYNNNYGSMRTSC